MCVGLGASLKRLRALVSKKKRRFIAEGFDLDLTYVTRRIIAMGYPSVGGEGLYRNPLAQVQRFFETRHAGRYRIYNLCAEREYDPGDFCGRVVRFPFEDHNPCLLEVVPRFCADVHAWLAAHPANVVGIHCKAGKGRTGMLIAAYLLHSGFRRTAHSALAYFGAVRTKDGKGVTIPSQMRMVYYYEKMLKFGAPPVFTYALRWVRLRTIPNVDAVREPHRTPRCCCYHPAHRARAPPGTLVSCAWTHLPTPPPLPLPAACMHPPLSAYAGRRLYAHLHPLLQRRQGL